MVESSENRKSRARRYGSLFAFKSLSLLLAFVLLALSSQLLALSFCSPALAYTDKELDEVLTAADTMFSAMKEEDFGRVWSLITVKSKEAVVRDVYTQSKIRKGDFTEQRIREDFDNKCGPICRVYWRFFVMNFEPAMALSESKWEPGFIDKDKAEILIIYKNSETPARLKMFRDKDGNWKVGLVESFGTTKALL